MLRSVTRQGLLVGATLATLSIAPAPPEKPPISPSPSLLERRHKAALKLYDVAWVYWREKRINVSVLQGRSLDVLRSECDLRNDPAGRMAAFEAYEKRFQQLESLLAELKRKRVVTSAYDIAAAEFYKLEIEYQLELEKARSEPQP